VPEQKMELNSETGEYYIVDEDIEYFDYDILELTATTLKIRTTFDVNEQITLDFTRK
jgi:hypothetical protein